uniref:Uncharacterized protein n=1 Tax=Oryza barthii TaxID=65489 RepID=A0A0D3G4H8_9ORYZ
MNLKHHPLQLRRQRQQSGNPLSVFSIFGGSGLLVSLASPLWSRLQHRRLDGIINKARDEQVVESGGGMHAMVDGLLARDRRSKVRESSAATRRRDVFT